MRATACRRGSTWRRTSKARALDPAKLAAIRDPHVRVSLELQRAFGLRREEALKLRPRQADQGDRLVLQGSWTKGGKPRTVPIRTAAQRAVLERATALAGTGSLIPPTRRFIAQLRVYEYETGRVGLTNMHGLRHAYAQERYQELTGWAAPAVGGPTRAQLTPAQRERDLEARLVISRGTGAWPGADYHRLPGALSAPAGEAAALDSRRPWWA